MLTWLRKNMKSIMIVVAVLFVGSMFYGLGYRGLGGGSDGGGRSNQIAKVNGKSIDPVRFREIFNRLVMNFGGNVNPQNLPFVENMALNQAVEFTLMVNEAQKKVKVPGRELDAAIDGIMHQQKLASKRDLENVLKKNNLTMGKFRDIIKQEILVQKLFLKLQEEVKVTPDDLREVRASHILVSNEATAKQVLTLLKQGGDFSDLAKEYSQDPGSAKKGGDLGYFSSGMMVPSFEKVAFGLKVGQTSGLVQTPFGYHIILVTDSRLRQVKGSDKDIDKVILKQKQEANFRNWFGEIRQKAKVEILSPELKANDYRFKGKVKEAIEEYNKAIRQDPGNAMLHIFLADTYISTGQKSLAFAEYENAARVEGGNPQIYLVVGQAYDRAGEKAMAAEHYKKASMIAGDNKAMHEQLLKVFQQLKRPAEIAMEKGEIRRIEKKEAFQKELLKK